MGIFRTGKPDVVRHKLKSVVASDLNKKKKK